MEVTHESSTSYFGMVCYKPSSLLPGMKAPHFDSTLQDAVAVVHFMSGGTSEHANVYGSSGTAFYREKSSMIERVWPNVCLHSIDLTSPGLVSNSSMCVIEYGEGAAGHDLVNSTHYNKQSYLSESDTLHELLEVITPKPNRAVVFPQALLHNGFIDNDTIARLSSDPKKGRITGQVFAQLRSSPAVWQPMHDAMSEADMELVSALCVCVLIALNV